MQNPNPTMAGWISATNLPTSQVSVSTSTGIDKDTQLLDGHRGYHSV